MAADREYIALINTQRWRKLRKAKLTKNPLCERCAAEGRWTPATEVHHLRPVQWAKTPEAKAERAYDMGNLQSLCHECHTAAHKELGKWSRENVARARAANLARFKKKFEL